MKKLLFIGDVVGEAGCDFLAAKLPGLKRELAVDVTVVNGENSAKGNGISKGSAASIISAGADIITTGNHAFRQKNHGEVFTADYIIRPANYPEGGVPGNGVCVLDMGSWSLAVVNLMGTVFMDPLDNPFSTIDRILQDLDTPNIFVDLHGEATSEKKAMGHYLTGKVTGVFGTHTHVQTADEIILGGHTAYITDAGMTGAELSCIGVDIEPVVEGFRFRTPMRYREASGDCFMCGVWVEFDEKIGKSHKIERIIIR